VTPSTVSSTNEGEQEGRNKLVENFGRKIRPGGLREQFVRAKQVFPERSQGKFYETTLMSYKRR